MGRSDAPFLLQIVQYIRRSDWREAPVNPLNRQFCMAVGSANAAETAQLQRIAPVLPPLHIGIAVAADVGEKSAENAKAKCNTDEPPRRKDRQENAKSHKYRIAEKERERVTKM